MAVKKPTNTAAMMATRLSLELSERVGGAGRRGNRLAADRVCPRDESEWDVDERALLLSPLLLMIAPGDTVVGILVYVDTLQRGPRPVSEMDSRGANVLALGANIA